MKGPLYILKFMIKDKINVLIVDDHVMIRNGLKLMLENQNKFSPLLFEAAGGKEALQIIKSEQIDVVLLDVTMPEIDGLTVLRKLKELNSEIPVIMLTMHKDKTIIKQAYEFGAHSYVLKNSGLDELTKAILTVINNEKYFSNEISQLLFDEKKIIKRKKH